MIKHFQYNFIQIVILNNQLITQYNFLVKSQRIASFLVSRTRLLQKNRKTQIQKYLQVQASCYISLFGKSSLLAPYHQPQANYYPQQNYVAPMQVHAGFNSGLDALSRCPSVFIKQRPDYLETLGLCEKKNAYFVYQSDSMGNKPDFKQQAPIFKCKEESSCWQRNCLPGACRGFDLKIKQYNERQDTSTVFRMSREFKCTCLCFGRPVMEVQLENGGKIGSIYYPFMCCDKGVDILDENDQMVYQIRGSCCQWPFLVNLPCETCQRARFDIIDSQGQKISELWKESAGFCNALCDVDATNFRLLFPIQSSSRQKALLLAAALFIDFNYFEESPQDKQNNQF